MSKNYRENTALFLIQPWTNIRCDEGKYRELVRFAKELEKRRIPIVYETYSSYFIQELYDVADIRIIQRVKDAKEIGEYLQDEVRGAASYPDEDDLEIPHWNPDTEISDEEDWNQTLRYVNLNEERLSGRMPDDDIRGVFEVWRLIERGFHVSHMPRLMIRDVMKDEKESKDIYLARTPENGNIYDRPRKTRVYEKEDKGLIDTSYILGNLNSIGPAINYFLITGGYANDCVDERIDFLLKYDIKLRLLSRYLTVRLGDNLEKWLRNRPTGGLIKRKEKVLNKHYSDILKHL